jgi:hypothetical protein
MNPVHWALSYAVRGWHVFPLRPGQKTPLTERGQNEATVDPAVIEQWWHAWPHANVGIHARPSGLYVVDVDCGPGKRGAASWDALRAEHGDQPTYTVRTQSGGLHLYYAAPAGLDLTNTAGRLGVDIDTRGNGYVVAPPSTVGGRAYSVVAGVDPAPLPGWIIGRLGAVRPPVPRANGARPAWNTPSTELDLFRAPPRAFTPRQAWAFVEPRLAELAHARTGTINDRLNAAAKALSHFGDDYWPRSQAERWLYDALSFTEYDGRTWRAEATIDSAYRSAEHDWRAELVAEGARFPDSRDSGITDTARATGRAVVAVAPRRLDLTPWLDGSYVAPTPAIGLVRDDAATMLYPAKWHTVIGSNTAGKTWFALAACADEMRAGRTIVYAHFEEVSPAETIDRLILMGLAREILAERFVWLDCAMPWAVGEFAEAFAAVWPAPSLVVLDGINAACTRHGQDPTQVQAVGWYRAMFVTPAAMNGAAVLSLGHTPKAREKQAERFGYGSTAWLDEVDGVGFRMAAHSTHPIRRGATGSAMVFSVKDRAGSVELNGRPSDNEGFTYLGSLVVDNATDPAGGVRVHMTAPVERSAPLHYLDAVGEMILDTMRRLPGRRYESQRSLIERMQADGHSFDKNHIGPALIRLEDAGLLERDPESHGTRTLPRPGWLVDHAPTSENA